MQTDHKTLKCLRGVSCRPPY